MQHAMYCENGHRIAFIDPETGKQESQVFYSDFLTGHIPHVEPFPLPNFCAECGAKTMSKCKKCSEFIVYEDGKPKYRPNYCTECGEPFPWTSTTLAVANEYADELDELTEQDRATLKGTFVDLTRDTPKTELAVFKFQRILDKVGKPAAKAFWATIQPIATEYVKRKVGL